MKAPRKVLDRQFVLALNGQDSEVDVFIFFLAEKLGKTVGELADMSQHEYMSWISYFKAKNQGSTMKEVS